MKLALERPELISLAAGFTDNDTLPVAEVAAVTRDLLRHPRAARAALQYGTTPGLPALRHELVRRLRQQDGETRATADDVIVTGGSQELLYLTTEALCDPGDIVIVEDPTYFVYLGIIEALGLRAVGFDTLDRLKTRLQELKNRRQLARLKLLYLVTYYQNPTGRTWSLEAKREALALVKHYERAAGHPIYLVEDAGYRDLRIEGDDVASFLSLDSRGDRVVYSNTLSKPFATGLRLGYGVVPSALRRAVLRSKGNHDFGSANFLQAILARALAGGLYARHLPVLAAGYRRKRDAMLAALAAHFPATARYEKPLGGMFVWVTLPGVNTGVNGRFFRRALAAKVLYVPGAMCYAADPSRPVPTDNLRLSFGASSGAQLRQGVRRLAGETR